MTVAAIPSAFDLAHCIPDLKPKRRDAALAELVGLAHQSGSVREAEPLLDLLLLRERLGTTAIGKCVAVPHARSLTVVRSQLVVARSKRGVDWNAPDGQPIQLILLVLSPAEATDAAHQGFLARAVAVARLQRNRQKLLDAPSFEIAQRMRELVS
ncbi:MAG TPA: PTS sugar transporter subunit IIA [Candidatus Limnocylindria bacterium]|nr:PTS sugar transporter subunit IIA [Candidatus Limnocylindria bacterium]